MSMFIINWIVCIIILLIVRKVWQIVLAIIGWRVMYSEWAMNFIKERDPEYYEEVVELKRRIEEEIKGET